jgi:hypothetical protein
MFHASSPFIGEASDRNSSGLAVAASWCRHRFRQNDHQFRLQDVETPRKQRDHGLLIECRLQGSNDRLAYVSRILPDNI